MNKSHFITRLTLHTLIHTHNTFHRKLIDMLHSIRQINIVSEKQYLYTICMTRSKQIHTQNEDYVLVNA